MSTKSRHFSIPSLPKISRSECLNTPSAQMNEMNYINPIYVCIISVFVGIHTCQFSHTHANLMHPHQSAILASFLTHSTKCGHCKWMTLKTFCVLRKQVMLQNMTMKFDRKFEP